MQETRQLDRPPHFTQTLVSAVAAFGDEARFEGIVTGNHLYFAYKLIT